MINVTCNRCKAILDFQQGAALDQVTRPYFNLTLTRGRAKEQRQGRAQLCESCAAHLMKEYNVPQPLVIYKEPTRDQEE